MHGLSCFIYIYKIFIHFPQTQIILKEYTGVLNKRMTSGSSLLLPSEEELMKEKNENRKTHYEAITIIQVNL